MTPHNMASPDTTYDEITDDELERMYALEYEQRNRVPAELSDPDRTPGSRRPDELNDPDRQASQTASNPHSQRMPWWEFLFLASVALLFDGIKGVANLFIVTAPLSPSVVIVFSGGLACWTFVRGYSAGSTSILKNPYVINGAGTLVGLMPFLNTLPTCFGTVVTKYFVITVSEKL
jgi:hypothetical protein